MKKHLHETMGWPGPISDWQYQVWQSWLDLQWNIPSRSDFYLLRIAQMQATAGTTLDQVRVKFGEKLEVDEFGNEVDPRTQAEKDRDNKGSDPSKFTVDPETWKRWKTQVDAGSMMMKGPRRKKVVDPAYNLRRSTYREGEEDLIDDLVE